MSTYIDVVCILTALTRTARHCDWMWWGGAAGAMYVDGAFTEGFLRSLDTLFARLNRWVRCA